MSRWFHGISRDLLKAAFSEYFGLAHEYIDIVVILYERPYESMPIKKLRYLLNSHRPPTAGVIHERIRVLREVMEAESIDSGGRLNPEGYRLSEVGYDECKVALKHMADVLAAHTSAESQAQSMLLDAEAIAAGGIVALPAPKDAA